MLDEQLQKHSKWVINKSFDYVDKNGIEHNHGICPKCQLVYDFGDLAKWFNFCPCCGENMRQ